MENRDDGITIQGIASSVIYQNLENGYAVLRVDVAGETVTCVGCMPGISPGEELELTGRWKDHTSTENSFRRTTWCAGCPRGPRPSSAIWRRAL